MSKYAGVLQEIQTRCFSCVPIAEELYNEALRVCGSIYSLSPKDLMGLRASEDTGVLGYYPAEAVLEELGGNGKTVYTQLPKERLRGYCSFDFLQPDCSQLGSAIFRRNQIFGAPSLNSEMAHLVERLHGFLNEICQGILKELANLDKPPEIDNDILDNSINLARFLRYPPGAHLEQASKPHTDYEFLTMIIADEWGLEVKGQDGAWRAANCIRPTAILLPGDMLQDITNGAIMSPMHRVKHGRIERRSIILFHGVNCDYRLQTQYQPASVTFRQHLCSMLLRGAPHLDETDPALVDAAGGIVLSSNPFKEGKEF